MGIFNRSQPKGAYDLNWGIVTLEFFNEEKGIIVHVFNHSIEKDNDVDRNIRFIQGRINWYRSFFHKNYQQVIEFDDRGQKINIENRIRLKEEIQKLGIDFVYSTER